MSLFHIGGLHVVYSSSQNLICTIQNRTVTVNVSWYPGTLHQDQLCCVCNANWPGNLPYEIVVNQVTEGRYEVIELTSDFGQVVVAFVQEKLHHNKPLCNNCFEKILNEDFPD